MDVLSGAIMLSFEASRCDRVSVESRYIFFSGDKGGREMYVVTLFSGGERVEFHMKRSISLKKSMLLFVIQSYFHLRIYIYFFCIYLEYMISSSHSLLSHIPQTIITQRYIRYIRPSIPRKFSN